MWTHMYFILSPIDIHVQQESTLFAFESHDKLHWSVGCIFLSQGESASVFKFSVFWNYLHPWIRFRSKTWFAYYSFWFQDTWTDICLLVRPPSYISITHCLSLAMWSVFGGVYSWKGRYSRRLMEPWKAQSISPHSSRWSEGETKLQKLSLSWRKWTSPYCQQWASLFLTFLKMTLEGAWRLLRFHGMIFLLLLLHEDDPGRTVWI